jgi:hypothetical protein
MTTRNGTTSRNGQHVIEQLGNELDASEIAQSKREIASGHGPHYAYEKWDAEKPEWRCPPDCPDCVHRELVRRYRAVVRAPVIARGHRENRRIVGGIEHLQAKLRTALARYDDKDNAARMNEYGEVLPAPRSTRERIDLAAEIEALQIDIDMLIERRAAKLRDAMCEAQDA